jgi:6-phosphogluconolactonase/glucosamine-6-phosphate isomerase/deaminase
MISWRRIQKPEQAAIFVKTLLASHLDQTETVLWLLPGGSAVKVAIKVADKLTGSNGLNRLHVSLTDERFGLPGHRDSNWKQLKEEGFILESAKLHPVLEGKEMSQTAMDYGHALNRLIDESDYSVALAGMGADGHIFGIKPHSPAINANRDVIGYEWSDYKRLTPTFKLLKRLDQIIIYAVGEEKWPQLDMLSSDISPKEQPGQFLKRLKKVIILNDYKGESL